jgi:hypothetical protein
VDPGRHVVDAAVADVHRVELVDQIYTHGWYGQGTYWADDISLQGAGGSGVPGAPSNLNVTGTSSSSISLGWAAGSGTITGVPRVRGFDPARAR